MSRLPLLEVPIVDYGDDEAAMVRYRAEGEKRAARLGNRGPLVLDDEGRLDEDILAAYARCGFYVFEGLLGRDELDDIERDLVDLLDRVPVAKDATVDRHGRRALGVGHKGRNLVWVRPLSDPVGGTD